MEEEWNREKEREESLGGVEGREIAIGMFYMRKVYILKDKNIVEGSLTFGNDRLNYTE